MFHRSSNNIQIIHSVVMEIFAYLLLTFKESNTNANKPTFQI